MTRARIIDRVRVLALKALWTRDDATWSRCCDIMDRDAKRVHRQYTAQKQEAVSV